MTPEEAISFISQHGIVLEAANGPVPSLAEAIAGEAIHGSWWAHPRGKEIFSITRAVRASKQMLVCRLIDGKITFVHRRLWPALIRSAEYFQPERLARLTEEHTASGRHVVKAEPFPGWVPADVLTQSRLLSEPTARSALPSCCFGRSVSAT
ncbi:MAG: hypothetical protein ACRESI_02020 [Gammaproteobacteria bacterium]